MKIAALLSSLLLAFPLALSGGLASGPLTMDFLDPVLEASVKHVVESANQAQSDAFVQRNPELMHPTASDGYFQELVRINRGLASDGATALTLVSLEWGPVTISGDNAHATTVETWRTDYSDGIGEEDRARNDYTLVRDGTSWRITADLHGNVDDVVPSSPVPSPSGTPQPAGSNGRGGQSHNWSGYSASGGTFTSVTGSWVVPRPNPSGSGADATWVGIGGIRTRDLIQAGTEQSVSNSGRVIYQAWIEKLPQTSRPVKLKVSPGDSMTVSITQQADGTWHVALENNSTSQAFEADEEYDSSRASAEWVQEAPSSRRGVLPLDNFGSVAFTGASAVKDGQSQTIAGLSGRAITMTDRKNQPIAQPSVLGDDGASFTVTRVNYQPGQVVDRVASSIR